MSLESYIKLENKETVIAALKAAENDVQQQVVNDLGKAGVEVRNKLRDSLPEAPGEDMHSTPGTAPYSQTGELKRKIQAKVMPLQLGEPVTLSIHVTKKGFYGRILEFGSSKMAARPWFFSGIAQAFPVLKDAVAEAVAKVIERRNKRK